jgi:hypothetical protein
MRALWGIAGITIYGKVKVLDNYMVGVTGSLYGNVVQGSGFIKIISTDAARTKDAICHNALLESSS